MQQIQKYKKNYKNIYKSIKNTKIEKYKNYKNTKIHNYKRTKILKTQKYKKESVGVKVQLVFLAMFHSAVETTPRN